jgi:hypothetical protein
MSTKPGGGRLVQVIVTVPALSSGVASTGL